MSGLTINGTLKAIGQDETEKIIFTSFKDDEYGGDTNSDGNVSFPQPGNWKQIYFTPTSQNSELNYVIVRYGGEFYQTWPPCVSERATIKVDRSSILFKNSILEKNKSRGLWLINSSSVIENSQFLDHQIDCRPLPDNQTTALLIQEGNPRIENCQFEKNIYGIWIEGEFEFRK